MDNKMVLILSPHTDDGELGAGGTISRFLEEGKECYYVAFSGCEISVPIGLPRDTLRKECPVSTGILGLKSSNVEILDYEVRTLPEHRQEILQKLIAIREKLKPDLVLVPSSHDVHQDHQVIYWEALRAFKKESSIWGYEHPWNNMSFNNDVFVVLNMKHVNLKIKALKEYKSQSNKSYMNENNILALCSTRGAQIDKQYAETFELLRSIIN
jgi:LmbE family N-acetylglucosaminyl deacetylase